MDEFARLPGAERRVYFEQAAARLGLSAQIIEKDFWVCWSLRRLFSLDEFRYHLTFKGGTSLSKVYRVIERFSEDVDISIERDYLGFGGEKEPARGASGKEKQRRIDALKAACQSAVADRLAPQLRSAITAAFGRQEDWDLSLDPSDPDGQSVVFQYPPAVQGGWSQYLPASVKIELGARSDHFPVENRTVKPYLSEAIPDAIADPATNVRVLAAARTFLEKATILHRLHHHPEGTLKQERVSRHYYDVYMLSQSGIWNDVLRSLDLLGPVVEQTILFFPRAWARYDEAATGHLHLSPPDRIVGQLKQDYRDMGPMFFGNPPSFDEILAHLPKLEGQINQGRK